MKWLVVAAILWVLLAWVANRSTFQPMPYPGGDWKTRQRLGASDVRLSTLDSVALHGWWLPAEGAAFATIHFHGNAGNVTHREPVLRLLHQLPTDILIMDYRGYGHSQGRPTENRLYEDSTLVYQALRAKGYPPERIVIFGESLGTVYATELASRLPCAGLVLEAPFPSARAVAQTILPVLGPMLVWGLDTASRIARVQAPVLVVQGDQDEVIAPRLGRAVFDAAREPKRLHIIAGAGHNNLHDAGGAAYLQVLRDFYASLRR
jgi:uncharacterized protein